MKKTSRKSRTAKATGSGRAAAGRTQRRKPTASASFVDTSDGLPDRVEIVLDGRSLSVDLLDQFLSASETRVKVSPDAVERVSAANRQLAHWLKQKFPIYGITRGLGPLKDKILDASEELEFQKRILLSHATGFGRLFPDEIVRLALLIRANVSCIGTFGNRLALIARMLDILNAGVVPQVPIMGSLGSGDLQPMAALGLVLTGDPHGTAKFRGEVGPAPEILKKAGLEPHFPLETGEALSIISGSTMIAAGMIYALCRIRRHVALLDGAYAVTMEALRGEIQALDPRTHAARRITGQIEAARSMRTLLVGSQWTTDEGRARLGEKAPRVQDAVSLRSSPHIHGTLRQLLDHVTHDVDLEINASTLNPLILRNDEKPAEFEIVMGGNYDGSHLAHLLDYLAINVTDCAGLSTTRTARLISSHASYGLPENLVVGHPGLNSGLVQVQSLQLSILGQMRQLATPASIHSLTAKDMQEDHNSMANAALSDLLVNLVFFNQILAAEFLLATQAIDIILPRMKGLPLGQGTAAIRDLIRTRVAPPGDDRFYRDDLLAVLDLVENGELVAMIHRFTGSLRTAE
jgi:histidine ammonia-lyase